MAKKNIDTCTENQNFCFDHARTKTVPAAATCMILGGGKPEEQTYSHGLHPGRLAIEVVLGAGDKLVR